MRGFISALAICAALWRPAFANNLTAPGVPSPAGVADGMSFPPQAGGGGGGSAWVYVKSSLNYAFSVTSAAATLSGNVVSGNRVIICAEVQSPGTVTGITISDDKGSNTYTPIGSMYSYPANNGYIQMFISGTITNAPHIFTMTPAGASSGSQLIAVDEYSGLTTGLDSTGNFYNGAVGTNPVSGSFTPSTVGDLIVGCSMGNSKTITAGTIGGSAANSRASDSNGGLLEDGTAASTSSQTASFTSLSQTAMSMAAAFK